MLSRSCVFIGTHTSDSIERAVELIKLGFVLISLKSPSCEKMLKDAELPFTIACTNFEVENLCEGSIVLADFESFDQKSLSSCAILRESAVLYNSLSVFINLNDFDAMLKVSHQGKFECNSYYRRQLAIKTFKGTAEIDNQIANSLATKQNTVLIVGNGGREHAIATKLFQSDLIDKIFVAPGNGGTDLMRGKVSNVKIDPENILELVTFAVKNEISLVVVGPEQPLVLGLVDEMSKAGISCFGPSAAAARIEGSKAWAKDFMQRHHIATASYKNFDSFNEAKAYLLNLPEDQKVVVKASGLAAGKGVILPATLAEAIEATRSIMEEKVFGAAAGGTVVIEELMTGPEISLLSFCDGVTAIAMPAAQDHKRVFDEDQGPNTGGMGAYAPSPLLSPLLQQDCMRMVQRALDGLRQEGCPFRGVLYMGLMLTGAGPKVVEFNCRFGDPETQVILPLLDSDLFPIMLACSAGQLSPELVRWSSGAACTVVCAAGGYPGPYARGLPISGLEAAAEEATVVHGGTALQRGDGEEAVVTAGGRVLAVTGCGATLREAVDAAYRAARRVSFPGMHFRSDIAQRGLTAPVRLGVLGSTRGSSLQAVIDAIAAGSLNAVVSVIVSDKAEAGILQRATSHGIAARHISAVDGKTKKTRKAYDAEVTAELLLHGVELVLMVGYMRIVSAEFTEAWRERCLNVHPSLLPEFAGGMDLKVHEAVLAAGRTESGCSVHVVTEAVDGGPVVVQRRCPVLTEDTPETLKQRVQALEGPAFIEAIRLFQTGRLLGPQVVTYRSAGVDIDAGEALVERIKPFCKATRRAGCDADLGGFGGLFDLAAAGFNAADTVLVSGTDGVGTKLKIAQQLGKHDTIGIDLVAMSVNDILVCGAEPLFFLDYFACGSLDVAVAASVVQGIAAGCKESGCALIGGETAEMSGMYANGEYDLAGFAVGAVSKAALLPRAVTSGDVLIGLRSAGVHSNGYSLVRKCVQLSGLSYDAPCPYDPLAKSLGDSLLCPTRLYVRSVLPLVRAGRLKGLAHITGGGLLDNIPRILSADQAAELDAQAAGWELPPVFRWLQSIANLPQVELLRTFNCGVGMVLVVAAGDAAEVLQSLQESEGPLYPPLLLGRVRERRGEEPQVSVLGEVL